MRPAAATTLRAATLAGIVAFVSSSSAPPVNAEEPAPRTFARLSVTVRGRDEKGPALPTPFTVLSNEKRAAVYVPESGGILLLEGDQVRHHFPIPAVPADASAAIDDLDANETLLVGGRWTPADPVTVELFVFDIASGKLLEHIESRNPRLGGEANERARFLWRVVIDADTVGVYDPRLGASVPLWVRGAGPVASADQVAQMRAGIGFGRDPAWVPTVDGLLSIRRGGKSTPIAGVDSLLFLDGILDPLVGNGWDPIALMIDVGRARGDSIDAGGVATNDAEDGRFVLIGIPAPERTSFASLTVTADPLLELRPNWIHGRPVRIRGQNYYYPYIGRDFLEIRRKDVVSRFMGPE
jgi:hypothetical protein